MSLTNFNNIKDHPLFSFADKAADICKPLFDQFPVNYFSYQRYYPGNKVVSLLSSKNWIMHYLQKDYPMVVNNKQIQTWSSIVPLEVIEDANTKFNFFNGIIMEKRSEDFSETLCFASPNQHSTPIEFCCNKILLNEFLCYFKEQAKDCLKILEKEPL